MEDAGRFGESFDHYSKANALQREMVRYDADQTSQLFARIRATVTADLVSRHAGTGAPAPDPIFVLGLPRSGSTLIEQILASHSQVEGTQELANVQRAVLDIQGVDADDDNPRYPAAMADMSEDDVRALGERYLAETQA